MPIIHISKHVWMTDTRPCAFCLRLQGGSVFADFDLDPDGRAYVVRISFDGYGCCGTEGRVTRISVEDSLSLTAADALSADSLERLSGILQRYLREDRDVIWDDALQEHGLL